MKINKKAFTLVELLVVVLIIGILAAIAVPQYQKAVYKSRYAQLKFLLQGLFNAEQAYFLANNEFTDDYSKLDVTLPAGGTHQDHITAANRFDYDWGWCQLSTTGYLDLYCVSKDRMEMEYVCNSDNSACSKRCAYRDSKDGLSDIRDQICQQETGKSAPENGYAYYY